MNDTLAKLAFLTAAALAVVIYEQRSVPKHVEDKTDPFTYMPAINVFQPHEGALNKLERMTPGQKQNLYDYVASLPDTMYTIVRRGLDMRPDWQRLLDSVRAAIPRDAVIGARL